MEKFEITTYLLGISFLVGINGQVSRVGHRPTHVASNPANDLFCHQCKTMEHGEKCAANVTGDFRTFGDKCTGGERTCMVQQISFTTSTGYTTWSVKKKCTNKCEPGCLAQVGPTKLLCCTTCCEVSFCNISTGAANYLVIKEIELFLALLLQITLTIIVHPQLT